MKHLKGQNILVTGGAGGLGRALINRLMDEECSVIALDRDEKQLRELYSGSNPVLFQSDITDPEEVASLIGRISEFCSNLDAIIHLAGTLEVRIHGGNE